MAGDYVSGLLSLLGAFAGAPLAARLHRSWIAKDLEKDAHYLAVRAIPVLNKFVSECAAVAADDGLVDGQLDQQGRLQLQTKLPEFPIDSLEVNWKALPKSMMSSLLGFNGAIDLAKDWLSGPSEHWGEDEYVEERRFQFSELGLKAATIADDLRKKYDVPKHQGNYDPTAYLSEINADLQKRRLEAACRPSLFDTMNAAASMQAVSDDEANKSKT